jgi:hypothetical protein
VVVQRDEDEPTVEFDRDIDAPTLVLDQPGNAPPHRGICLSGVVSDPPDKVMINGDGR